MRIKTLQKSEFELKVKDNKSDGKKAPPDTVKQQRLGNPHSLGLRWRFYIRDRFTRLYLQPPYSKRSEREAQNSQEESAVLEKARGRGKAYVTAKDDVMYAHRCGRIRLRQHAQRSNRGWPEWKRLSRSLKK